MPEPSLPEDDQDPAGRSVDRNGLEILTRTRCLELLASAKFGRVAISHHALPVIFPVTYGMLGQDIVFAAGPGSRSLAVAEETVMAFEVDEMDPAGGSGWSVLAIGTARPFGEDDVDLAAARELDLHPWLRRHSSPLIRLPTELLSGRILQTDGSIDRRSRS